MPFSGSGYLGSNPSPVATAKSPKEQEKNFSVFLLLNYIFYFMKNLLRKSVVLILIFLWAEEEKNFLNIIYDNLEYNKMEYSIEAHYVKINLFKRS